jgi:hypothetical protein
MHVEVLVEDVSGKRALEILIPKMVGGDCTFRIHSYKGIGHIPKDLRNEPDPTKRMLLANLPRLLKGYGMTFAQTGFEAIVIVVCDLDDRKRSVFLKELNGILETCNPPPMTRFCLAIEEGEAWFLGDSAAVIAAYPKAKADILNAYVQDSICGTWETLANAVHPGGLKALSKKGYRAIGEEKSRWAKEIAPRMDVENNRSLSFSYFRDELRSL